MMVVSTEGQQDGGMVGMMKQKQCWSVFSKEDRQSLPGKSHRPEGAYWSTPSFKGSREVEPSSWVSMCPVTPDECGRLRGRVVASRTGISLVYRWGDTGLEAASLAYSNRVDGKVGFVATPFAFRVCSSVNGNFFT